MKRRVGRRREQRKEGKETDLDRGHIQQQKKHLT
jgi:hypothetical protein